MLSVDRELQVFSSGSNFCNTVANFKISFLALLLILSDEDFIADFSIFSGF